MCTEGMVLLMVHCSCADLPGRVSRAPELLGPPQSPDQRNPPLTPPYPSQTYPLPVQPQGEQGRSSLFSLLPHRLPHLPAAAINEVYSAACVLGANSSVIAVAPARGPP